MNAILSINNLHPLTSYWICTLSNKYKCKMRVIAEHGKPFCVRFKGPGHNHGSMDYSQSFQKSSMLMEGIKTESMLMGGIKTESMLLDVKRKSDMGLDSDIEWKETTKLKKLLNKKLFLEIGVLRKSFNFHLSHTKFSYRLTNTYFSSSFHSWRHSWRGLRRWSWWKSLSRRLLSDRARKLPLCQRIFLSTQHRQCEHNELALYIIPELQM